MNPVDGNASTMIGPEAPPSKWSLDHVPTPILDSILQHLCLAPKLLATVNSLFPLSPDLKAMSLVDHTFRQIILKDLVLHTVMIKSHANAAEEALAKIRKDSFRYIKQVNGLPIFLGL